MFAMRAPIGGPRGGLHPLHDDHPPYWSLRREDSVSFRLGDARRGNAYGISRRILYINHRKKNFGVNVRIRFIISDIRLGKYID